MKTSFLTLVSAAAISIAGIAAGFTAELPTFVSAGLPISAVQVQLLGAANIQEQSPTPVAVVSPHQLKVLTPRTKITAATASVTAAETARSVQ
ncbi:MAG: hypothetical protein JWL86_2115 [Rhizobium sp.]|nr:hypothetical protein [Rhizobium sp.]